MTEFKVDFDSMTWQSHRPGARYKLHRQGSRQIRLVEFLSEEVDPQWCSKGHIGLVLAGSLEIDFGRKTVSYSEGDGIFIPSGPSTSHRANSIIPGTRLLLVEEI